jgi:vacuolar-type H+-ATPase subunit E/Vma4
MSAGSIELDAQLIERVVDRQKALIARAEEEGERVLQEAGRECERIRVESDKQILNIVGSELRAVRDRIVGRAELEGRKLLMLARDDLSSSVFNEAERRLWEMAEGRVESIDFGEVLVKLIVEAASAIGGEEFIAAANERDLKYLKTNLKEIKASVNEALGGGDLRLDVKPVATMGGVVVRNIDGSKIYYNTLEGRLKNVRSRIEALVAETLGVI